MQYPHHFKKMGCNTFIMLMLNLLNFFVNLVPNPNPSPQEVLPPMQDQHGDAMEENEWVHEGSRGCYKVNACISSSAAEWLFHKHLN
jgi:hypothetical protein